MQKTVNIKAVCLKSLNYSYSYSTEVIDSNEIIKQIQYRVEDYIVKICGGDPDAKQFFSIGMPVIREQDDEFAITVRPKLPVPLTEIVFRINGYLQEGKIYLDISEYQRNNIVLAYRLHTRLKLAISFRLLEHYIVEEKKWTNEEYFEKWMEALSQATFRILDTNHYLDMEINKPYPQIDAGFVNDITKGIFFTSVRRAIEWTARAYCINDDLYEKDSGGIKERVERATATWIDLATTVIKGKGVELERVIPEIDNVRKQLSVNQSDFSVYAIRINDINIKEFDEQFKMILNFYRNDPKGYLLIMAFAIVLASLGEKF